MMGTIETLTRIKDSLKKILGIGSFKTVDPGESHDRRFYAIQALDGDVTFTATTVNGDDITSNRVLQQDATLTGEFDSISVDESSTGIAIIYTL